MRILTLNHEYPPIGGGGGQASKEIIEGLIKKGHEVTLITAHYKGLPKQETSQNLRILRVFSFRKYPYRIGVLGMGVYIISAIFSGLKTIRHWSPVIIHAHFAVPAGAAAYVLHKLTGIPYVLTVHLGDVPGGVPEKTKKWFRWIYPFTTVIWQGASVVIAVSQFTASLAQQHYLVTPRVIPNGIAIDERKKVDSVNHPAEIVFAGRFVPQKNIPAILDILNSVRELDWHCDLIGDGPLFQWTKAEVERLGLGNKITLTGWLTVEEVEQYLNKSDILLMPSLSEGLPVVGLQALSRGLAIIATNVGGFNDLVENGENGYLAELNQVAELKSSLHGLLESPEKLLSARRKSLALAHKFEISSICDQYEKIFKEVAKE